MFHIVKPFSEEVMKTMWHQTYLIDLDISREIMEEEEDRDYESRFAETFPDDISPAKNKVRVRGRRQANDSPSGSPNPKRRPRRHKDEEKMKQHNSKVAISKARLGRGTEDITNHFESSSEFRDDNSHLTECCICLDMISPVPEWDVKMAVCDDCCGKYRNEAESLLQGVKDKLTVLEEIEDAFNNCEAYLKRCRREEHSDTIEMDSIREEKAHCIYMVKFYNRIINPPTVIII